MRSDAFVTDLPSTDVITSPAGDARRCRPGRPTRTPAIAAPVAVGDASRWPDVAHLHAEDAAVADVNGVAVVAGFDLAARLASALSIGIAKAVELPD